MDFDEDLELCEYEDEALNTYRDEQKAAIKKPCVILSNVKSLRTAQYVAEHFRGDTPLYISVGDDIAQIGEINFELNNVLKLRVLSEDMVVSYVDADGTKTDYDLSEHSAMESLVFSRG